MGVGWLAWLLLAALVSAPAQQTEGGGSAVVATALGQAECSQRWGFAAAEAECAANGLRLCSKKQLVKARLGDAVLSGANVCGADWSGDFVWTRSECGGGQGRSAFRLSGREKTCVTPVATSPRTLPLVCCGSDARTGVDENDPCAALGQDSAQCQADELCEFVFTKRTKGKLKGRPYGCQAVDAFCGFDNAGHCQGRCSNARCAWSSASKTCALRADAPMPGPPDECSALGVGATVAEVTKSCATNAARCRMACQRCVRRPEAAGLSSKSPHIILSVADDMGWNDIGYHNDAMRTPTLDGLAAQGIRLERHYAYRFCSPSRSQLLTGTLPWRQGQQTDINMNPYDSLRCALQEEVATLPELLQSAGYKTHMVGKWHLGSYAERFTPTRRGFSTFVGYYAGAGAVAREDESESGGAASASGATLGVFEGRKCTCAGSGLRSCKWWQLSNCVTARQLFNNSGDEVRVVPLEQLQREFDYADLLLAAEAARVVRAHKASRTSAPLFLYAAWDSPHDPHDAPERFQDACRASIGDDTCARRTRLKLGGMMNALDEAHAVLLRALKETGMWKDTVLVFLSDNGGYNEGGDRHAFCPAAYARQVASSNFPLRGGKFTFFEGGIRTAAFVSGGKNALPDRARGTSSAALFSSADWLRTLLGAAGLRWAAGERAQARDSVDQWPALLANDAKPSAAVEAPRTELAVQVFGRRAVLFVQRDGVLYKLLKGYPGYIGGIDWVRPSVAARRRTAFDDIHVPIEMDAADVPAELLAAPDTYLCETHPCVFDVTNDPAETTNLASDFDLRNALLAALEPYESQEVSFPASKLCRIQGTSFDSDAFVHAKKCNAFASWLDDDDNPMPCPPELELYR